MSMNPTACIDRAENQGHTTAADEMSRTKGKLKQRPFSKSATNLEQGNEQS